MKKVFSALVLLFLSYSSKSQVAKKVVVEHFTNTKCSICASRNPGFYTNYNTQTGVIHLAIHPSSPYSNCYLSQHNPIENDGRTNYYGVYGGTPRLTIQGVVISSSANYASSSIFTPYLGQLSPASIKIYQYKFGNDSIRSRVVIKTVATHTLNALSLFVALAEDTINYTGSNGESQHYDVFRKSLTGTSGIIVALPAVVGDSLVYIKSSSVNTTWNFSRIYTMAILQETANKSVVQAQSVFAKTNYVVTDISEMNSLAGVYVYIAEKNLYINKSKLNGNFTIDIFDVNGKLLLQQTLHSIKNVIDLNLVQSGVYLYRIRAEDGHIKNGKLFLE